MTWLLTRTASINLGDDRVQVIEGGVLQITREHGKVDYIGPGFWVAVTDDDSSLDWDNLVPSPEVVD
jgi:hypothetical protein